MQGLPVGNQVFEYLLGDEFWVATEANDIRHGVVNATVQVNNRGNGVVDLDFKLRGTIYIDCDRCLDEMALPVEADYSVTIEEGDTPAANDDEVIRVPATQRSIDLSGLMRDTVLLCIPIKHTHADGECNTTMMDLLSAHTTPEVDDDTSRGEPEVDPRWAALKALKDEK